MVAVVAADCGATALARWQALPSGSAAAIIGRMGGAQPGRVAVATTLGGERYLEELEDDPLPRIC